MKPLKIAAFLVLFALPVVAAPVVGVPPVQGVTGGQPVVTNQTQVGGVAVSTGAGAVNTGTQRVVINSDVTDATFNAFRVSARPPEVVGCYAVNGTTGTYGGLAANTPLFSLRWGDATHVAIIMRVEVSVFTTVSATTAGFTERQLIVARAFTVADSGGAAITLTGNNQKRRTSQATSLVSDMRFGAPLTAGTRTLDAQQMSSVIGWSGLLNTGHVIGAFGNSPVGAARSTEGGMSYAKLLDATNGQDYPIILAQNEGIVVRIGQVMPTGATQQTFLNIVWCEANSY